WAWMTLHLHDRRPADPALPARVLALRQSPLAQRHPDVKDQLSVIALEQAIAAGRGRELARELACLDSLWICGPFDNERGAAFQPPLPSERAFEPGASYPGKQRPVAWRRLAGAAPNGRFELGEVLRPNTQVACTVAAVLVADADTDAALHLGCAGSFRVRL